MKVLFTTKISLLTVAIFSVLFFAACSEESVDPVMQDPGDGMMDDMSDDDDDPNKVAAPDFNLTSISDTTVSLSEMKGKVVVLFFFGDKCPLCRAVAPTIEREIAQAYIGNDDFAIVGLDQWNGNKNSVVGFKTSTGVSFELLLEAAATARDYSTTYDRLVVVDKEGNFAFRGTQAATNDIESVKSIVESLL